MSEEKNILSKSSQDALLADKQIKKIYFGKIGKRGTMVVPAIFRQRYGLLDDTPVIIEAHAQGLLIKPAQTVAQPISQNNSDKAFWKEWFHLTDSMHLSPDEVQDFKNEGRR